MFRGPVEQIRRIAERTGARYVDPDRLREWLGKGDPHPALSEFPTAALLAPPDKVILPPAPARTRNRTPRRYHSPRTTHPPTNRLKTQPGTAPFPPTRRLDTGQNHTFRITPNSRTKASISDTRQEQA